MVTDPGEILTYTQKDSKGTDRGRDYTGNRPGEVLTCTQKDLGHRWRERLYW